jgi:hypothetical protein
MQQIKLKLFALICSFTFLIIRLEIGGVFGWDKLSAALS